MGEGSKVKIQIFIKPNHEIPDGLYHDEEFFIIDSQWQNMRSAITQLEAELLHYGYGSLEPKVTTVEREENLT